MRTIGDGWMVGLVILWVFSNVGDSMICLSFYYLQKESTMSILQGFFSPFSTSSTNRFMAHFTVLTASSLTAKAQQEVMAQRANVEQLEEVQ